MLWVSFGDVNSNAFYLVSEPIFADGFDR